MNKKSFSIECANSLESCNELFGFYEELANKRWQSGILNDKSSLRKYKEVMNNNKDKYCYSILIVVWFAEFINYCYIQGLWNQFPKNCNLKAIKITFVRRV